MGMNPSYECEKVDSYWNYFKMASTGIPHGMAQHIRDTLESDGHEDTPASRMKKTGSPYVGGSSGSVIDTSTAIVGMIQYISENPGQFNAIDDEWRTQIAILA